MNALKKNIGLSHFLPYLEKHRIYELFNDIITELVIKKPSDHLIYIKKWLENNPIYQDCLKIILLSRPDFDKKLLAEYLEKKLNIPIVRLENKLQDLLPDDLVKNLPTLLDTQVKDLHKGWIFIDFPRDNFEARVLKKIGILPTHVFEIITSDVNLEINSTATSNAHTIKNCNDSAKEIKLSDYNLQINGLRNEYKYFLYKMESIDRTYEEIGNTCVSITRRKRYNVPCIYRVLLIGPRGSGVGSVAKYLSQKYDLVNVDFNYLLEQTKEQNSLLGEELRCLDHRDTPLTSEMRFKIVENKLMSHECIKKGWILTKYPFTGEDFQLLNSLTTPPNRIIFLNVDQVTCRERLLSRQFNILTGSEHHLTIDRDFRYDFVKGLAAHPKDYRSKVEQDLKQFEENSESILKYAGESVDVVDASPEIKIICERVDACLTRPIICKVPAHK
ncbi:adenylate kinase 8 [Microplitis mediator]|uniref:adenylate kinase 8 n=1 Tax=Microplitis mediator TaxID=375433 RepID=UPI0025557B95|nr:adenylate kinase 8 [Microplitis mediator]